MTHGAPRPVRRILAAMKQLLAFALLSLAACGGSSKPAATSTTPTTGGEPTTMVANPAAVYCEQLGGTTENRPTEGGEAGWCLKDGKECDQWALYRGECPELGPAAPEAGTATEPAPQ